MEYKDLLKKAREKLPKSAFERERFEVPKVLGHIQGNRTIISNFLQVTDVIRREPKHMLKYILRELATPGEIKKSGSVIIGTKVPASRINEKVRKYVDEFVLCTECGKPDTKLEKEGDLIFLKCMACGARNPVKSKI